jgi:hypothetical protein
MEQVSREVTGGEKVTARPPAKVEARGLTLEYDAEPYPEVTAAFDAYRRVVGVDASLADYRVRPVEDATATRARVTARVQVRERTFVGSGVGDDVIAAAVQAFESAVGQASTAA